MDALKEALKKKLGEIHIIIENHPGGDSVHEGSPEEEAMESKGEEQKEMEHGVPTGDHAPVLEGSKAGAPHAPEESLPPGGKMDALKKMIESGPMGRGPMGLHERAQAKMKEKFKKV